MKEITEASASVGLLLATTLAWIALPTALILKLCGLSVDGKVDYLAYKGFSEG